MNLLNKLLSRKTIQNSVDLDEKIKTMSIEEIKQMFLELNIYQLELEMQNNELIIIQEKLQTSQDKYIELYNDSPVGYITLDNKNDIIEINFAAEEIVKQIVSFNLIIHRDDQDIFYEFQKQCRIHKTTQSCDLRTVELSWLHLRGTFVKDSYYIVIIDITKQKQDELKFQEEHKQLQQSLAEIKILQGILPICSYCKKIRNDKGYWDQLEEYFSNNGSIKFSHGICPTCFKKEMDTNNY